jgi:hypothetical protein
MTRDNAYRLAIDARANARCQLDFGFCGYVEVPQLKNRLAVTINDLHDTLQEFEECDACELHEELYLPLFDALSLLTDAQVVLKRNVTRAYAIPEAKKLIDRAVQALEEILAPAARG